MPTLVIVTGPPATGKTAIGRQLARLLDLPAFHKDDFKECLAEALPGTGLGWSQQLGRTSYLVLYQAAAATLESGHSCLLEANFHPQLSLSDLRRAAAGASIVQVRCVGDPEILMRRYLDRHAKAQRHAVHVDADQRRLAALREDFRRDHRLDLPGTVFECDTTADLPVDVDDLAARVSQELEGQGRMS